MLRRAGRLREQRQREELVAYVFCEFLAGRDGAEAVGGHHQLDLGQNLQDDRHADGDAELAVAQIFARYADGADHALQREGHDGFVRNGQKNVLVDGHAGAAHPFLAVLIDEEHVDGNADLTAYPGELGPVAQAVDGEIADGSAGGGGAAALEGPRAAGLRMAGAVFRVFDGFVISKGIAAAPAGTAAAAAVALAGAGAGDCRAAGRIRQYGHDAGDGDDLIVELLLLETGIVNVFDLNAHPLGQSLTGISGDAAGRQFGLLEYT